MGAGGGGGARWKNTKDEGDEGPEEEKKRERERRERREKARRESVSFSASLFPLPFLLSLSFFSSQSRFLFLSLFPFAQNDDTYPLHRRRCT